MKYTISYIRHDALMRERHLLPSLDKLEGEFDVDYVKSEEGCPAKNYNKIIDRSKNRYIIFTHEDIAFTSDMLKQVDSTIEKVKRFGVLGLVGKTKDAPQRWSKTSCLYEYITVDCCFFIIDKQNCIRFDNKTFDGLHMYGEDYARQCTGHGLINYSIYTTPKHIKHHSNTCKKKGWMWGNWKTYKKRYTEKWKKHEALCSK